MSPALHQLFHRYAAASFEKQLRLNELAGECDWNVNLDTGVLSLGDRYHFPIQLLGTESAQSGTWLWAWANPSIENPAVLSAARRLQEYGDQHGVPEFVEDQFPLDHAGGHSLGLTASGILQADAYYLGHYGGGAALMLLDAPEVGEVGDDSALRMVQVFTQFISSFPCDHRPALLAYAQEKGYAVQEGEDGLQATNARGGLRARFDTNGRLEELRAW